MRFSWYFCKSPLFRLHHSVAFPPALWFAWWWASDLLPICLWERLAELRWKGERLIRGVKSFCGQFDGEVNHRSTDHRHALQRFKKRNHRTDIIDFGSPSCSSTQQNKKYSPLSSECVTYSRLHCHQCQIYGSFMNRTQKNRGLIAVRHRCDQLSTKLDDTLNTWIPDAVFILFLSHIMLICINCSFSQTITQAEISACWDRMLRETSGRGVVFLSFIFMWERVSMWEGPALGGQHHVYITCNEIRAVWRPHYRPPLIL